MRALIEWILGAAAILTVAFSPWLAFMALGKFLFG